MKTSDVIMQPCQPIVLLTAPNSVATQRGLVQETTAVAAGNIGLTEIDMDRNVGGGMPQLLPQEKAAASLIAAKGCSVFWHRGGLAWNVRTAASIPATAAFSNVIETASKVWSS
jgi:hypothetical protein